MRKLLLTFIAVFIVFVLTGEAFAQLSEGIKEYNQGRFAKAQENFEAALKKNPKDAVAAYNLGAALYKQQQFDKAAQMFASATEITKDQQTQFQGLYNKGNSLLKEGVLQAQQNGDVAIKNLEESLKSYEQAKGINGKDEDLKTNAAVAKKILEELKKQQQQKKNQQNQQDKQDKQDKSQDHQQNNNNQNQENQNKDQDQQSKDNQETKDQDRKDQQEKDQQKQEGKEQRDQKDQEQKAKEEQAKQEQAKQEQDKKQQQAQSAKESSENPQDLTKQQAEMMIDDYERNDAPKGLLNFVPRKKDDQNVSKDW